jgi:FkbM family methyltransferase
MKVALLLSGQFRNAKECFPGIKKNVLDVYNPDVFISGWINPDEIVPGRYFGDVPKDDCSIQEIVDIYNPLSFEFETFDPSGFLFELAQELDINYPNVDTKTTNVLSMWYKRSRVNELKRRYEEQINRRYDLVILCRFDLEIVGKIDIPLIRQNTIYIPEGFDFGGGINDLIAISDSEQMDYYVSIYDKMKLYRLNESVHFSAHILLDHHLETSTCTIKRFLLDFKIRNVNVWKKENTKKWKIFDDKINEFFYLDFKDLDKNENLNGYDFLFWEIFNCDFSPSSNVYEMWDCTLKEGDIVVDLGSNVGFFSYYASMKASQVIAVDGSPEVMSCLVENCKDRSNIKILNASALDKNGNQSHLWSFREKESVLKYSLEEIMKIFNLDKIDFLKIDIEGGEYDLLKNLDINILNKIDRIAVEAHDEFQNETFYLPGKIRHSFLHNFGGGHQTFLYFVTPPDNNGQ